MQRAVGRNRAKHCKQNSPASLSGRRCGAGKPCAGWPRPCPPPHAAFRTRCPRTVQRVRSEAHYAAAAPRRARPASGGGPGKAGQSAALTCRRSLCPGGAGGGEVLRGVGRVPARRRTRRFGHFALKPGKVFAPRRTTRRQCRVGLGRHRAADGAKRARAPPCLAAPPSPPRFFARPFPACPGFAPLTPGAPFARREQKIGKIRRFCDISAFANRICF